MVICIGMGLTLLGPWVPWPGLWAVLGLFFLCPGCGLLVLVLFAFPGLWGFCLVVLVGCARMWVLGLFFSFDWLFVLFVPVCG